MASNTKTIERRSQDMRQMSKKQGFTLVELLVVLVIIGIIIGLILPNTLRAIAEANAREDASNIRTINTAIQLCYATERDWAACDDTAKLLAGEYLDVVPVIPFTGGAYEAFAGDATSGYSQSFDDRFCAGQGEYTWKRSEANPNQDCS